MSAASLDSHNFMSQERLLQLFALYSIFTRKAGAAKLGINTGNDNWQICAHTHTTSNIDVNIPDREHWKWADTELPFDAISWLNKSGLGPDPMVKRNDLHYQWVEDVDWVLRKHFRVEPGIFSPDDELQLFLDHVDCYCDVFLDGKSVGRTQNQFREHAIDIDELAPDIEHELLLYIRSARNINNVLEAAYGQLPAGFDSGRVHCRRCQSLTGWDFTPRLSSVSVLTAPEIRAVEPISISHPHVYASDISGVQPGQATMDNVQLNVLVDVTSRRRATGELSWEIIDLATNEVIASMVETISLKPRRQQIEGTVKLPQARLWWSAGLGDQPLYRAVVKMRATDRLKNEYSGEKSCTFGVRSLSIERLKDESGESFMPRLNGAPIFCRGANWLPVSMLPANIKSEDYEALIASALGAGMNCLRVWGGGVYEHDEFYDLCDRAGILVWQDFMFACAAYPVYREFLDEVEAEAIYQVQRLRNHPCMMVWCGNSENEWLHQAGNLKKGSEHRIIGETIWSHVLREVVEDYHPASSYHQASPFGKNRTDYNDMASGDRHNWSVWADWESTDAYLQDTGRFISEFGMQALPSSETIQTIAPGADSLDSPELTHHQRMTEGTERLVRYVAAQFAIPQNLDEWIDASQQMQAMTLGRAVEHWRRQRHHTAGSLVWHFNDPYPALSWSLVDYYRRPKAALMEAQRFFAPVLISMELQINDISAATIPPGLAQDTNLALEPPCPVVGDQQITCTPFKSSVQCRFHLLNATALQLAGVVYVEFIAPDMEPEEIPGVQVTVEPNTAQVAITHLLDDALLARIDQMTVRARFELDKDSQTQLKKLGDAIRSRQHDLIRKSDGSTENNKLILLANATRGLSLETILVEPKYFRS